MHKPSSQIERDVNDLKRQLAEAQFSIPLPAHISSLEGRITRLTQSLAIAETNETQGELRSRLRDAMTERDAIAEKQALAAKLQGELVQLQLNLQEAVQQERMELALQADKKLQQAIVEYQHASLVCGRAARKVMDASAASSRVPGASYGIQHLRLNTLNLPAIFGISNQGTLGTAMLQARQAFENDYEAERSAA